MPCPAAAILAHVGPQYDVDPTLCCLPRYLKHMHTEPTPGWNPQRAQSSEDKPQTTCQKDCVVSGRPLVSSW
jgi:hypothetical protein